ncbi:MAG TPA: tripartite tricarboxylate transporter substrate-binding protein [Burkholderiales bacterium]|nr:tripartite tricarboxylate transporter substrate-binding protein [Burkholderiales bacterium]
MVQRPFLLFCASIAASIATGQAFAQADQYPSRPVRMIIPFAPGGASDFIGRILQPKLAEELGQQVVVDNRAGASGTIGVETAANATPDGYTFLLGNVSSMGIGPNLFTKIRSRALNDLVPITLVVDVPGALGIHGGLPPNNIKEFIAYARSNTGKLSYGSAGYASAQRMAFEFFMSKAGIKLLHVPYKGGAGASTIATISGEVAATMVTTASLVPHAKTGKVKVLAVVAKKRVPALPDTPTMIESGYPELDLGSWQGIYVPRGTPKPAIDKLYKTVVKVVHDPWTAQQYSKASAVQVTSDSPTDFSKFMHEQVAFWGKITKDLGIKVE